MNQNCVLHVLQHLLLIFCFIDFPLPVGGAGIFELQMTGFSNPTSRDSLGRCCGSPNDPTSSQLNDCPLNSCRVFLRICLKQYQTSVDPEPPCTYGSRISSTFVPSTENGGLKGVQELEKPLRFPFSFAWPGSFSIIVEAWHQHSNPAKLNEHDKQLVLRLAEAKEMPVGASWVAETYAGNSSTLDLRYRAVCDPNYYGPQCMVSCTPKDDSVSGHYSCDEDGNRVCSDGWKGKRCLEAVCREGCVHGTCDEPGQCLCELGYIGELCQDCQRYPGCQHGYCDERFTCKCHDGWGGLFCNQDLNYCTHHSPCKNEGICENTGAGWYTCACEPGFTGVNCEIKIEDCSMNPCLHGTCQALGSNYTCECDEGYSGRHCQTWAETCAERPCENQATCVDTASGYMCLCPPGWEGDNCDTERDECQPNPCENGGRCMDSFNGFKCVCPVGYSGERCQDNQDDCSFNACLNGGQCQDLVNSFRCVCKPGYTGMLCQDNFDDCIKRPCANGGTCIDKTNDYMCHCRPGFKGKDCSIDINECAERQPCRNGGSCEDLVDDYTCHCTPCFSGKDCHIRDEYCISDLTFRPYIVAYNATTPAYRRSDPLILNGIPVTVAPPSLSVTAWHNNDPKIQTQKSNESDEEKSVEEMLKWEVTALQITVATTVTFVVIAIVLGGCMCWMCHKWRKQSRSKQQYHGSDCVDGGVHSTTPFTSALSISRRFMGGPKPTASDLEAALRDNKENDYRLINNVGSSAKREPVVTPYGNSSRCYLQSTGKVDNCDRAANRLKASEICMAADLSSSARHSLTGSTFHSKPHSTGIATPMLKVVEPPLCPENAPADELKSSLTCKFPLPKHNIFPSSSDSFSKRSPVGERKVYRIEPYCHTPPSTPIAVKPPQQHHVASGAVVPSTILKPWDPPQKPSLQGSDTSLSSDDSGHCLLNSLHQVNCAPSASGEGNADSLTFIGGGSHISDRRAAQQNHYSCSPIRRSRLHSPVLSQTTTDNGVLCDNVNATIHNNPSGANYVTSSCHQIRSGDSPPSSFSGGHLRGSPKSIAIVTHSLSKDSGLCSPSSSSMASATVPSPEDDNAINSLRLCKSPIATHQCQSQTDRNSFRESNCSRKESSAPPQSSSLSQHSNLSLTVCNNKHAHNNTSSISTQV